ncbi:TatD family hydrolase [Buchnera aphidicola]|uniref:TatD family deoxyribonuclease n=1 Tax=Buchnera aphidicola (Therioaphis trifolii) TaxID=1241884 RepID=A0A4D6YMS6_9GAMM|nr:TatD family hydrolase [Buchnera aphidicola]QCI27234.1 TatD family deoxyribonuclease [Buchnera aphidicola (Therioaphis trifolii)]
MYLIDSHCHLNLIRSNNKKYNINTILKNAKNNSVKLILNISTSITDYLESFQYFKKYINILYSCGIHPLNKDIKNLKNIDKLEKIIICNKNIIALGETGLDFFYSKSNCKIQIDIFQKHIYLGKKYNKPIIIHTRNAKKDTINILSNKEFQSCSGVIHSFTGDIEMARKLLNLGFYISFSGIVTFKNALYVQEIAKFIPIDRLLIETDSPYLSPEPHRGKSNQPANLLYIANYISKLKKIHIYDMSKIIKKNFYSLFKIN